MEKEPLLSQESITRRNNVLQIVAAYRGRDQKLCAALLEYGIRAGTDHNELTSMLLHEEISHQSFTKIAELAKDYLAGLSDEDRLKALESAVSN